MKKLLWGLGLASGLAWANFSDLPPGPIAQEVLETVQKGWMEGYPDGSFRGQEALNRYQMAVVLGRVLKDLEAQGQPITFKDVPPKHWAAEALALAVPTGLIAGYPDGTFRGQEPLTRGALSLVLARLLERLGQTKEAPLPWDVPEKHWAALGIKRILGAGIMDLNPDASFAPDKVVNRYELARALARLKPLVEARTSRKGSSPGASLASPAPKANPAQPTAPAEPNPLRADQIHLESLEIPARWVGMARGRIAVLGEKALWLGPDGLTEAGEAKEAKASLPPWSLVRGGLENGGNRYVALGGQGGKEVLPKVMHNLEEGHLALDPSGNYLLLTTSQPLCNCPSLVIRLVLLLTNPVGLYAEYVYLLDEPGNKVVGVAWPEAKNLLIMEASQGKTRLYRINLNAGEDIAFSAWDEGGLEARSPLPVRPVNKVLMAELPLEGVWGLAFEGPDRLLTVRDRRLNRLALAAPLW